MKVFYKYKTQSQEIRKIPFEINDPVRTLSELIENLVVFQINNYTSSEHFNFLNDEYFEKTGTVNKVKNNYQQKIDVDSEIIKAKDMVKDGLAMVYIDDIHYDNLEEAIHINEGSEIVILRLTYLAGRWY